MARDFRAKQLRTSVVIGSGSIESTKPHLALAFYSSSKASDFEGTRKTGGSGVSTHTFLNNDGLGDPTAQNGFLNLSHADVGDDVWCLFDGASHGSNASLGFGIGDNKHRLAGSTVLFIGDVVISGSLFAERQMVEVDTTTAGDFRTPVGSAAYFDGGFASSGVDITAGGEIKAFTSVRSPIFFNDNANVTLKTTTAGNVDIHPISGITRFKFDADSSATLTVANNSHTTLATAESGNLTLDSAGTVVLDAASNAAGGIVLNSAGGVSIDAAAGPISIDAVRNNADAINITTNAGAAEKILIKNTQGDTDASAGGGAIRLEATAGGISMKAAKDIVLNAAGGQITLMDDGVNHFLFDCDNTKFTIYDDANANDRFSIQIADNGETTITTTDHDPDPSQSVDRLAHLHLDVDGDMTVNVAMNSIIERRGTRMGMWTASGDDWGWRGYTGTQLNPVIKFQDTKHNTATQPSVLLHQNTKLHFWDGSQYIQATADNHLKIASGQFNTPGADPNTLNSLTLDAGPKSPILIQPAGIHLGNAAKNGVASKFGSDSKVRIFVATGSMHKASAANAADPFDQGGKTAGNIPGIVDGALVFSNRTSLQPVDPANPGSAESNASGPIVFDGNVNITSLETGNMTVLGNLTVQGTTTTLNTETTVIADNLIQIGGIQDPSNANNYISPPTNDGHDRGIYFRYNSTNSAGGEKEGFFGFDRTDSSFTFIKEGVGTDDGVMEGTPGDIKGTRFFIGSSANSISRVTGLQQRGTEVALQQVNAGMVFNSEDDNYIFERAASAQSLLLSRLDSAISDGEDLGHIEFGGTENSTKNRTIGAQIKGVGAGTWNQLTDNCPTKLVFSTRDAGTGKDLTERMTLTKEGNLKLEGTGKIQLGSDNSYIQEELTDHLKLASNSRIKFNSPLVVIEQTNSNQDTAPTLTLRTTDTDLDEGAVLRFEKDPSDAGSIAQYENLGEIYWYGAKADGSAFYQGAAIIAEAESDWVDGVSHNTMLKFGTTSGTGAPDEHLTIRSDGKVGIGKVDPATKLDVVGTVRSTKLEIDGANHYIDSSTAGNAPNRYYPLNINASLGEAGGSSADIGYVQLSKGGTEFLRFAGLDGGSVNNAVNIHNPRNGTMRFLVGSAGVHSFSVMAGNGSLRMESESANVSRRLQFVDNATYIQQTADQELSIVTDATGEIKLGAAEVTINNASGQLNFNDTNSRIYRDGGALMFRDTAQTTPVSLSSLNSVAAAGVVVEESSGPDRARVVPEAGGGFSVSSLNKYVNEGGLQAAPVSSDLFFYVGDDAANRTNAAFKNDVAVSGSMRLVDNADGLSQTRLLQNADNLVFRMNKNTAAVTEAHHDILTVESASGLKLGTTVGSGNAGLYFQESSLNLQKVTSAVEGSAQSCIQIQGHLLPQADNSFNLGTADRRFANLYTGDLHLNNMGSSNDVDGTSGNWTIQEGEDSLYVINNLTGKKFKMMLQPLEDEE